nr:MAG TPA: hypothetical protein [Caudoviricetes sp.]
MFFNENIPFYFKKLTRNSGLLVIYRVIIVV